MKESRYATFLLVNVGITIFIFLLSCCYGNIAWAYPDVNKTFNGDKNACWIATAANLLQYTGWVEDAQETYDTILRENPGIGEDTGEVRWACEEVSTLPPDPDTWIINNIELIEPGVYSQQLI